MPLRQEALFPNTLHVSISEKQRRAKVLMSVDDSNEHGSPTRVSAQLAAPHHQLDTFLHQRGAARGALVDERALIQD